MTPPPRPPTSPRRTTTRHHPASSSQPSSQPSSKLLIRNHHHTRRVNPPKLRRVARALLEDELHLQSYVLDVHLVGDATIQHLNEQFLRHAGPTDVIAFDYSQETLTLSQRPPGDSETAALRGEIFLGIDVAFRQAPRFRTTPADELVRYLVHGILHLHGHDDHRPADRRRMKHEENRLLCALRQRFRLADLLPTPRSDFPRNKT